MKDFDDYNNDDYDEFDGEEQFKSFEEFFRFFNKLRDSSIENEDIIMPIFIRIKTSIPVDTGLIINAIIYNKMYQN